MKGPLACDRAGVDSKLCAGTVNGDTYPSKRYAKHSVASSNAVKRNEFGTFSSQMLPDALGQGGLRVKWGKGRFGSKNDQKIKVLRMGWPIVENVPTPCGIIFNLSRGP